MAKIGEGHWQGMARKGFKEIGEALKAFPESVRSPEEPGIFGNDTQAKITTQMGGAYRSTIDNQKENAVENQQSNEADKAKQYEAEQQAAADRAPSQEQQKERGMER